MGSCWSGDGGASWCIQHGRTAIHFPQLVIYGTAKRGEAGVRGTRPPELVHCPAPSCFTTQRAGLPNLRWQTVTYITPRLANEDWWCFKGSVYTGFTPCTKEYLFSPRLLLCLFDLSCFILFVLSHLYLSPLPPLSECGRNVKWLRWREASLTGPAPEDCALLFRETGGGHSR